MTEQTKYALVADDIKSIRDMVALSLKQMGFEVTTAEDGSVAYDYAKITNYDLVVTDMNMPYMNGIELIENIRSDSKCQEAVIFVLSTEGGSHAIQRGEKAGCNAWMVKPFRAEILYNLVKKHFN